MNSNSEIPTDFSLDQKLIVSIEWVVGADICFYPLQYHRIFADSVCRVKFATCFLTAIATISKSQRFSG